MVKLNNTRCFFYKIMGGSISQANWPIDAAEAVVQDVVAVLRIIRIDMDV